MKILWLCSFLTMGQDSSRQLRELTTQTIPWKDLRTQFMKAELSFQDSCTVLFWSRQGADIKGCSTWSTSFQPSSIWQEVLYLLLWTGKISGWACQRTSPLHGRWWCTTSTMCSFPPCWRALSSSRSSRLVCEASGTSWSGVRVVCSIVVIGNLNTARRGLSLSFRLS